MAKEKVYGGRELLAASRWQDELPSWPQEQQDRVAARVDELIAENADYCDEGNYSHLSNLLTALALYEYYQAQGKSKEEACDLVAEPMWAFVEKGAGTYRTLFKIPGMMGLFGRLMPKMFEAGSGAGWHYDWGETSNQKIQFTCTSCIYAQIFATYGVPELGPMFCHADDINYGHLKNITFTRYHTLCKDGQPCDFLFTRDPKDGKDGKGGGSDEGGR